MSRTKQGKSGATAGVLLAVCVSLLALPSAVLAFTADFTVRDSSASAVEADPDELTASNVAHAVAIHSLAKGKLFPFTPAGTPNRADRSVTVAVRVDAAAARAITVRGSLAQADGDVGQMRIAPTAFSLGVSRGYRNFAQDISPAPRGADVPDLRKYSLAPSRANQDQSRFSPRISLDDKPATGRAPRTFAGDGSEVDLGGAYRVTDHLDVTAGVRYSQERERLMPLNDGKQDSQAVYVGTQFHF
jgi:hypothetical protein